MKAMKPVPALRVHGLSVDYVTSSRHVQTVRCVSFDLHRGQVLGVVGESGSGKTTAALAALGWNAGHLSRTSGSSDLDGRDLFTLTDEELRSIWGSRIGYVPQEIGGALHPSYRLRTQFRETLKVNAGLDKRDADARAAELLAAAHIPTPTRALRRFPHEFSGGQLQRIAVALALAPSPDVLILDEPTTGLDVTTQKAVAEVLRRMVEEEDVAALFITHDLALLTEIADELLVMYAGEVVESGPIDDVIRDPRHPYSRNLIDAVPSARQAIVPQGIPGLPPGRVVSDSCPYADRCPHTVERCLREPPPLTSISGVRAVRCWRASGLALVSRVGHSRQDSIRDFVPVVEVRTLTCDYGRGNERVVAVDGVSVIVPRGGVAGIVGESGSGKSTLGRAIAGVHQPRSGEIRLDGSQLPFVPNRRTADQRRAIQIIFQNPASSLNPRRRIGDLLEHVAAKFTEGSPPRRRQLIEQTLNAVQLSSDLMDRYPAQLSGGQQQRVAIAAAFLAQPKVVICDEITSGQDVSVQAAILQTLAALRVENNTAVLFISHDLGVVRSIADHIYVMRHGRVVEHGPSERVFQHPQHPYTRELLAAVPELEIATPTISNLDGHVLKDVIDR